MVGSYLLREGSIGLTLTEKKIVKNFSYINSQVPEVTAICVYGSAAVNGRLPHDIDCGVIIKEYSVPVLTRASNLLSDVAELPICPLYNPKEVFLIEGHMDTAEIYKGVERTVELLTSNSLKPDDWFLGIADFLPWGDIIGKTNTVQNMRNIRKKVNGVDECLRFMYRTRKDESIW